MNPDGQTEWTDGRTEGAKTISLRLRRGIKSLYTQVKIGKYLQFLAQILFSAKNCKYFLTHQF